MLKLSQEGSDNEKIALLQSLLEDANRRKSELETENRCEHQHHAVSSRTVSDACWLIFFRLINQRLMEEQSQVEELQKSLQEQGSSAEDVSSSHCPSWPRTEPSLHLIASFCSISTNPCVLDTFSSLMWVRCSCSEVRRCPPAGLGMLKVKNRAAIFC